MHEVGSEFARGWHLLPRPTCGLIQNDARNDLRSQATLCHRVSRSTGAVRRRSRFQAFAIWDPLVVAPHRSLAFRIFVRHAGSYADDLALAPRVVRQPATALISDTSQPCGQRLRTRPRDRTRSFECLDRILGGHSVSRGITNDGGRWPVDVASLTVRRGMVTPLHNRLIRILEEPHY